MRADDPFDTYLLRVLTTLVAERSVSRTAIKLNQSQPAISAALKRLREIVHDPLLVRDKGTMMPTQRALELDKSARIALEEIHRMIVGPARFDPAGSEQTFRIGSPDFLSVFFMSRVVEDFRRQAPGARLSVHPLGVAFDYEQALAQGELDVVIGNWPRPPEALHLAVILEDDLVCLLARDHPYARRGMTSEQYLNAAHLVPVPYSVAHRGVVETHLASMRVRRNATVMLPFFNMAPYLLPNTDLIFTTSRHFAQYYADILPLAIVEAPIPFPRMRFYQLWHERTHHSQPQQWLRSLLTKVGRELAERGKAPSKELGSSSGPKQRGASRVPSRSAKSASAMISSSSAK
jgi:DNA-binding transcriptional LysR family regulator